eukprot:gene23970-biopygen9745
MRFSYHICFLGEDHADDKCRQSDLLQETKCDMRTASSKDPLVFRRFGIKPEQWASIVRNSICPYPYNETTKSMCVAKRRMFTTGIELESNVGGSALSKE